MNIVDIFKVKLGMLKDIKKALIELVEERKSCLDLKVVIFNKDYLLMYSIGSVNNKELFYKETEDLLSRVLNRGDFYWKIGEKDDSVSVVDSVKEFKNEEVKKILFLLDRGGFRQMIIPDDFFVFQFQTLSSINRPAKGKEGIVKEFICKERYLDKAIVELKKGIMEMNENYFRDFKVFYGNRWRLLKVKLNGGWLPKGYILATSIKEVF